LFRLFRYRSKTSKQTEKKKFWVFAKKQTEKQLKQIEFRFVSVRTEKKKNCFEDPLIENAFGDFFGSFRENSVCFGCFDTSPKHQNKPKKMFFGFAKQTEKQPKQDGVSVCFGSNRKKNLIVSRTP
jgi:hypothetical protein